MSDPITAVSLEYESLDWNPVDPTNPKGPQIAALWGDPMTTGFGALLRVPARFTSPMHQHSRDERVVQISGSSLHWTAGQSREAATVMNQGDYMMMPAGVSHISATAETESIEFITMDGPFDFHPTSPDGEEQQP